MNDAISRPSLQRQSDRERGQLAWKNIEEVLQQSDDIKKKYRTQVRQFTSLVRTNGLAQTLAFLYAKGDWTEKDERKLSPEAQAVRLILVHLDAAIVKKEDQLPKPDRLLKHLLHSSSQVHREATVAALAFARWLSRFAEAELPSEDEPSGATAEAQEENHGSTSPS